MGFNFSKPQAAKLICKTVNIDISLLKQVTFVQSFVSVFTETSLILGMHQICGQMQQSKSFASNLGIWFWNECIHITGCLCMSTKCIGNGMKSYSRLPLSLLYLAYCPCSQAQFHSATVTHVVSHLELTRSESAFTAFEYKEIQKLDMAHS